jgi:hypothetical protein
VRGRWKRAWTLRSVHQSARASTGALLHSACSGLGDAGDRVGFWGFVCFLFLAMMRPCYCHVNFPIFLFVWRQHVLSESKSYHRRRSSVTNNRRYYSEPTYSTFTVRSLHFIDGQTGCTQWVMQSPT